MLIRFLVSLLLTMITCHSVNGQSREDVINAWKLRAAQLRSARIDLEMTWLIPARTRRANSEKGALIPSSDVTLRQSLVVLLGGGRIRVKTDGEMFDLETGTIVPWHTTTTDNGDLHCTQNVNPDLPIEDGRVTGYMDHRRTQALSDASLLPLFFWFSPFDGPSAPFPKEDDALRVLGVEPDASTRELLKVTGKYPNDFLWLDLQNHYALVRLQAHYGGADQPVFTKTAVSFRDHESLETVPDQWVIDNFKRDGTLSSHYEVQVKQIAINPQVSGEDFLIRFPPGAFITDRREEPIRNWVVDSDGELQLRKVQKQPTKKPGNSREPGELAPVHR